MVRRDDQFVTVFRTWDPVRAEVIRDVLAQEGITATIQGVHHNALLGAAGAFIDIPVQVRRDQAEAASEIIAAMDDQASVLVDDAGQPMEQLDVDAESAFEEPGGDASPYRTAVARRASTDRPKLKRIAAFLSLALTFGTGHLYAGERRTGLTLLLLEAAAIALARWEPVLLLAVPALMLYDLVGSVRACGRPQRDP